MQLSKLPNLPLTWLSLVRRNLLPTREGRWISSQQQQRIFPPIRFRSLTRLPTRKQLLLAAARLRNMPLFSWASRMITRKSWAVVRAAILPELRRSIWFLLTPVQKRAQQQLREFAEL